MAYLNEQGLSRFWMHILAKLGGKVDKIDGKGLSTNDYTDEEKNKLNTISDLVGSTPVLEQISNVITDQKGANGGLAELDNSGKVPTSQLPSYVDDVLEYGAKSSFPTTGESGKIYVDTSNNKTYRWSGSAYVEISPSLALGTTSSTAYRGDRGAAAYKHAVTNKGAAFTSGLYKITTNSEGHVTNAEPVTREDLPIDDYVHPEGNAPNVTMGLYKLSTDATSHVNGVVAVTKEDITNLAELNYATDEDVEAMLEELFPTPSIPTGSIVLTCADGYTSLHTDEDIYITSGLNRLWEDDIDQTCYLLWKPDSSYSQAEYFEAQFEYINYEVFTGMYDGYYTIKFTNPLTNTETVYCIYDYYADYATLSTENNYVMGSGGTI